MRIESKLYPAARSYAEEARRGLVDRREFLARATALDVSIQAAGGLLGDPVQAPMARTPRMGGNLRVQLEVKALKPPRVTDWSSIANRMRDTFEHLVEYNNYGSFRSMLLEGWEVNQDATEILLPHGFE